MRKLVIFTYLRKKKKFMFGIHWCWWGLGSLLRMILNCIHAWGFRHTGMGWRSQQTLNCKGDQYLRTWKGIYHRERSTSHGESDSAPGLNVEGDRHFVSHGIWLGLEPAWAQTPGTVYVAMLFTGDTTGQETGELWHLVGAVKSVGVRSAAHRAEDEWSGWGWQWRDGEHGVEHLGWRAEV